ncbi:unnamed protein product [Caenorhabditis bovis]|uniref:Uncharacterized protein n=1 Tax=Caenorhabditis bovis TaxID=2654633 RepID=A0A8S1FCK6_9PELO|nr:unnamed protein product [Caenorhabditis bovis]
MKLTAVIFFLIAGLCSSTPVRMDIYDIFKNEPLMYATSSSMWEMPTSGDLLIDMIIAIAAFVLFALIVAVFVFPCRGKRI